MKNLKRTLITAAIVLLAVIILMAIFPPDVTAGYVDANNNGVVDEEDDLFGSNYGFWALLPPIIAISLALITKEVYPSLLVGVVSGAIIYSELDIVTFLQKLIFGSGYGGDGVFYNVIMDSWNMGIIIFLIALGALVYLMKYSGASRAFGDWARTKVAKRSHASLATMLLGIIIFVDDYFNCLTVGSVMRPVTDDQKISRAKLAYVIDCTAAPVCIIAPISSWAAAVAGFAPPGEGIGLFLQAIPYNYYALFTLVMVAVIALLCIDFGKMRKHEINAIKGDLFSGAKLDADELVIEANPRGKIMDMVVPIIILVVVCVFMMVCTGGIFDGKSFIDSFGDCDAASALSVGGVISLLLIMIYYASRGIINGKQCFDSIPEGFKAMFPAIFILIFAWALNSITGDLGAKFFIHDLMEGNASELLKLLPAVIFAVAGFLAFATGTSWGTFGIMIPIVVALFSPNDPLFIISLSACLAGAVLGDHISPISDTTIMASAGAQCELLTHVNTQVPYALTVAGVSFVTYIIAGYVQNAVVPLIIGLALLIGVLLFIKYYVYKGITPEQEAMQ